MRLSFAVLSILAVIFAAQAIQAREWTNATGKYKIDADLIAFNNETIVLKRKDGELGALSVENLSQADLEYLKSKEAEEHANQITGKMQTWTLRDEAKIRGRVVGYARREITLQRRRGKIYVNDRMFENLPEIYQLMLPKIVAHFDRINRPDKDGLEDWLVRQKGQPRKFTIEGVIMEFEDGDEYVVPFFFLSAVDLRVLKSGWDQWLAAQTDEQYDKQQEEAFFLQSLAAARQQDQEIQRRIARMQLNMAATQTTLQAVEAGVTSLWEVTLYPARGNVGPPLWVVMTGRTSRDATNRALSQNRGYVAGPVRKVSGL